MNQVLVQEEVDRLFKLLNENDAPETTENPVSYFLFFKKILASNLFFDSFEQSVNIL